MPSLENGMSYAKLTEMLVGIINVTIAENALGSTMKT